MSAKLTDINQIVSTRHNYKEDCKNAVSFVSKYAKLINKGLNIPNILSVQKIDEIRNEINLLKPQLIEYSKNWNNIEDYSDLVESIYNRFKSIFAKMKQYFPMELENVQQQSNKRFKTEKSIMFDIVVLIENELKKQNDTFENAIQNQCGYYATNLFKGIDSTISSFFEKEGQYSPIPELSSVILSMPIQNSCLLSDRKFWYYCKDNWAELKNNNSGTYTSQFLKQYPLILNNSHPENVQSIENSSDVIASLTKNQIVRQNFLQNDSQYLTRFILRTIKEDLFYLDYVQESAKKNKNVDVSKLFISLYFDFWERPLEINNFDNKILTILEILASRTDDVAMNFFAENPDIIDDRTKEILNSNYSKAAIELTMSLYPDEQPYKFNHIGPLIENGPYIANEIEDDDRFLNLLNADESDDAVLFLIKNPRFVNQTFFEYNKSPKVLDFIRKYILTQNPITQENKENICLAIMNNPFLSQKETGSTTNEDDYKYIKSYLSKF